MKTKKAKQRQSGKGASNGERAIVVRGARTHNLKNIHVQIPIGRMTVVTGPSGSGKSSLAFDTLFAEGQRRFVESMSTYARQFIQQMPRPDVEAIDNVLPAIALEQKNTVKNARSTVGTATEICDYLGLMFGRIGHVFCPACGVEVIGHDPQSASDQLSRLPEGTRLVIVAPIELPPARGREVAERFRRDLMKRGWGRLWMDGQTMDIEALGEEHLRRADALRVVTDRIALTESALGRLSAALETAFDLGQGRAEACMAGGESYHFSSALICSGCGRRFDPPRPQIFSFYSPAGACPACQGFGRIIGIDMDRVIPDPNLSMNEHPIHPWNTPSNVGMYRWFKKTLGKTPFPWDSPLNKLGKRHRGWVMDGYKEFWGVKGFFNFLERRKYKIQARVMLAKYRSYVRCEECGGSRLIEAARCVRVGGHAFHDLLRMTIKDLPETIRSLALSPRERATVDLVMRELLARLDYLNEVGLGYLTLDRQTRTLSGGETQRINLATALGSALTGTLYVLDEPTVGLHARDTQRLLNILKRLRDNGNTVVVVEHDPIMIRGADRLIDLGPAAGDKGGELIYAGSLAGITRCRRSLTGAYLRQTGGAHRSLPLPTSSSSSSSSSSFSSFVSHPPRAPSAWLRVFGARQHNLKNIDVALPLGLLCCLTGVSGSGKTSLLRDIVYAAYARRKGGAKVDAGAFDRIEGYDLVDDVLLIDQSPLGRSARSNPITYVKAYDPVRQLFAEASVAQGKRLTPSHFSFNVDKGRCPICKGTGTVLVDMHFLADIEMTCEACDGRRFLPEVIAANYAGRSIVDVLEMTVDQSAEFFKDHRKIVRAFAPLRDVGLGYLRLGQRTSTLSGGEAQRLKLAGVLATRSLKKKSLLLFDEPTTGLHPTDIATLLAALNHLVDAGNSVIVIEHNLDFIAQSDYVIDLGPEGGDAGGQLLYAGPLPGLLNAPNSHTARSLRGDLDLQAPEGR